MAPIEEVVGSIPHAGVVLTTIVHPTIVGGPWTLLYGYLKVLWGDTMSNILKALVTRLETSIVIVSTFERGK